jgi:hypothetical protein
MLLQWMSLLYQVKIHWRVITLVEIGDSTTVSMIAFAVVNDTYDYYNVLRFTVIVDKLFGTMQS